MQVNEEYLKIKKHHFTESTGAEILLIMDQDKLWLPNFRLRKFFTDIHKYLRLLEESVILTLKEYGLNGERSHGETGFGLMLGPTK